MNKNELQEEIECRLNAVEDGNLPVELALAEIMGMISDYCEGSDNTE